MNKPAGKPTLFFSHSSKDKELVLSIKERLTKHTGGALDIFMSSDGQSIPFGSNWVHKVEQGLNDAKIMFVFVTENAVSSGWIYFEAGFAYSKQIHVIPVGVGVDVGALQAPFTLLQGFNLTSSDSLNNFITIVNREFNYCFPEAFEAEDYAALLRLSGAELSVPFDRLVHSIGFRLFAQTIDGESGERNVDVDRFFNKIVDHLDRNAVSYSLQDPYRDIKTKCVAAKGVKIVYHTDYKMQYMSGDSRGTGYLDVSISPYSFADSFALYRELTLLLDEDEPFYLQIRPNDSYSYVVSEEDGAALIASRPEHFAFIRDRIGVYLCRQSGLRFSAFCYNHSTLNPDYVLTVIYEPAQTHAKDIMELISRLYDLKLIYKKTGDRS